MCVLEIELESSGIAANACNCRTISPAHLFVSQGNILGLFLNVVKYFSFNSCCPRPCLYPWIPEVKCLRHLCWKHWDLPFVADVSSAINTGLGEISVCQRRSRVPGGSELYSLDSSLYNIFICLLIETRIPCSSSWPGTCWVAKAELGLLILLPPSTPEAILLPSFLRWSWDYRSAPQYLVQGWQSNPGLCSGQGSPVHFLPSSFFSDLQIQAS